MTDYFSVSEYKSKLLPGVSFKLRKMSKGRRSSFNLSVATLMSKRAELQKTLVPINEEITRAEEAAKLEPCSCSHEKSLPESKLAELDKVNAQLEIKIEVLDGCHSSTTKRCMVDGCACRKPKPDPAIGGFDRYQEIVSQIIDMDNGNLAMARIRFFVSEVQGLNLDGKPANVELLISDGPEPLVDEVSEAINHLLTLSTDELLGFPAPTTGGAPVVRQEPTTDQPNAAPASQADTTGSATASSTSPS